MRVALWKEDNPGASFTWRVDKGEAVGIPAGYGADKDLVIVTLHHNDGIRPDVEGWVDVEEEDRTPDGLNTLITKALGRALKKNGFPDDMTEMKALMFWRERKAEIRSIGAGQTLPALTEAAMKALDAAGTQEPDGRPDQDGSYKDPAEFKKALAEEMKAGGPPDTPPEAPSKAPSAPTRAEIIAAFSKLPEALKAGLRQVPEPKWVNAYSAMKDGVVVIPFKDELTITQYNQVVQIISAWGGPDIALMREEEEENPQRETKDLWDRIRKLPSNLQEFLWALGKENGILFSSDQEWVDAITYEIMEQLVHTTEEQF